MFRQISTTSSGKGKREKHTLGPIYRLSQAVKAHKGISRIGSTWSLCNQTMHTGHSVRTHINTLHQSNVYMWYSGSPKSRQRQTPVTPTQMPRLNWGALSRRHFSPNHHGALVAVGMPLLPQKCESDLWENHSKLKEITGAFTRAFW